MFDRGYFTLGRVRKAPIRIHWSAPLGAIVFTRFSFAPLLWVGFVGLVILHELGHAAVAWRLGYDVVAVRVHAFGGDCQWAGDPTRMEDAYVAWGGVLAQALLWVIATALIAILGFPSSSILAALALTATSTNLNMILFNLIPIPPLDGHRAWPLIPMLWRARNERIEYQRARAERRKQKDREVAEANAWARTKERIAEMEAEEKAAADKEAPPPIPPEVQEVLDRVLRGEGKKPGDKPDPQ
ncbi:MAG: M50 family metallopeptidase [Polyangiaceae bacterium]